KNPAPYREQILTYSTALAFTGRSAACAPPTANKAAVEPRTRPLTIFIFTSKLGFVQNVVQSVITARDKYVEDRAILVALVDLSEPPKTGRPRDAPLRRSVDKKRTVPINQLLTARKQAQLVFFGRMWRKCHAENGAQSNAQAAEIIM